MITTTQAHASTAPSTTWRKNAKPTAFWFNAFYLPSPLFCAILHCPVSHGTSNRRRRGVTIKTQSQTINHIFMVLPLGVTSFFLATQNLTHPNTAVSPPRIPSGIAAGGRRIGCDVCGHVRPNVSTYVAPNSRPKRAVCTAGA